MAVSNDLVTTGGFPSPTDWAGNVPPDLLTTWGLSWWQPIGGVPRFTVAAEITVTVTEEEVRFTPATGIDFVIDD